MGNILSDFLVRRQEGYYCRYGDFFIDPLLPVGSALVSHAHADHATPGHGEIYCTPPTAAFMRHRYRRQPSHSFVECRFHQRFVVGGVHIHFVPAGHILGSAQIVMEHNGIRYLYTGDYKLQGDDTCEPLEPVQADVLITETTFADPKIIHPDPIAEISKINDVPYNILLGAYALGKAQRLTSLMNTYCPDRKVFVHHGILPLHRLYQSLGIDHLRYEPYSRKEMKASERNRVYIVPPMTFNSYYKATDVIRVFASGWQHLQRHNDMAIYISDHVDWKDILHYIAQVNPTQIWTIHGQGRHLAMHFDPSLYVRELT
ncbi:MBL fold metallo-hydrolase [Parapedobacter deserti]|uniref:MBL fold metallo-hydrolase n=1 Tax=Parapedobacter deserti TaxID=1912957 RepID=A0ABV7JG60_9SPHI